MMAYFGTLMTLSSNLETEWSEIASTEPAVAMQISMQSCSSGELDPYVSRNKNLGVGFAQSAPHWQHFIFY